MHAHIGKTKDTYIYTIYIYYICDIYLYIERGEGGRRGGGQDHTIVHTGLKLAHLYPT